MEKTLVILKPCTVQRGLIGEIVTRFEKKGLRLAGMKMVWLTDEILSEHYAHLKEKPFFQRIKDAMSVCPVIVCCWEGVDAIHVVRTLAGATNGRNAARMEISYPMQITREAANRESTLISIIS